MKDWKTIGMRYLTRQAVAAAVLSLSLCGGCGVIKEDTTSIIFSEDDTLVGYSWVYHNLWWEQDEGYFKGTTYEYVGFTRTDTPDAAFILQTLKKQKTPNFGTESLVKYVAISPDNKKMAIVSSNAVDIMDIATFTLNRLTTKDERVGTLRWLNAEEVVYTSVLPPAKNETVTYKCVFRQYFSSGEGMRATLFRDLTNLYEEDAFSEFWSPDGKAMLLLGQLHLRMLEIETGRLSDTLLERFGENRGVVWSPDSKKLFIAFGWSWDQKGKCGGILVQRKPFKITDYGNQVRQTFYTEPFRVLDWTKDGKYIIGWGMQLQTCLIDPNGWQVFWFEEKYNESLPKYESEYRIIRALVPGWLYMQSHKDGKTYAVDYYARYIIPIAETKWALSHNNKLIAQVAAKNKVKIHRLELPQLPPPPKPVKPEEYWIIFRDKEKEQKERDAKAAEEAKAAAEAANSTSKPAPAPTTVPAKPLPGTNDNMKTPQEKPLKPQTPKLQEIKKSQPVMPQRTPLEI